MSHNPNEKIKAANIGLVERQGNGKLDWTGAVRCLPERLEQPLRWKEPRRIFVDSLSDLFHEDVPEAFIDQVFAVMALCPQHVFQVLTKRPERMQQYLTNEKHPNYECRILDAMQEIEMAPWRRLNGSSLEIHYEIDDGGIDSVDLYWPLPNVWLGVSVEDQKTADERIIHLLKTPAEVRFLSCEPLLGSVDLERLRVRDWPSGNSTGIDVLNGSKWCCSDQGECAEEIPHIDWVIVGGESGTGARPMHPDWARALRDQCQAAGVAFFMKQWGEYGPVEPDHRPLITRVGGEDVIGLAHIGKKRAGRILDGRTWDQFPERP
jgi:protein gp37